MSVPSPTPDIGFVSASRRLTLALGFYLIALFTIVVFFVGSLPAALFLVVVAEILLSFWRPTPTLGPASYSAPLPAGLQTPIRALRWYQLISGCWSLAVGGVLGTVIAGIVIIDVSRRPLGWTNFVVAGLIAGWILTRPLWYPLLRKRLSRSFQGVKTELSENSPSVLVGADGIDVEVKVNTVGAIPPGAAPPRPWVFHVAFAEIEEVRTLDWKGAQAYWQSMEQYDASLAARAALELGRYIQGQLPRPSIFQYLAGGTHLLIRGPSVLYLIGWADESGPTAVAAWQRWRAAQGVSAGPPG